ncbi:MAG: immune inhibitor A [Gemmatimonadota bacterium]|nr:immune inhibitor A [Gemmatimonadota bacterium]
MSRNINFPLTTVLCWLILGFMFPLSAGDFTDIPPSQGPWLTAPPRLSHPNPDAPAFRAFISGESAGARLSASEWPKHLRVCAVRVEFKPDDNPKTTGTGTWGDIPVFTFNDNDGDGVDEIVEDPTVDTRDKEYTRRVILWVSQYWEAVSRGKVLLTVPGHEDISAIHMLDNEMKEYGDDDDYSLRESRLAEDAIKAADNELDYSKYDIIMVFHAGCGSHTEYLEDTPDDIHPVSINRYLLREILADGDPGYMGIPTNDKAPDGSQFFASFIQIFPETAVQDYEDPGNRQGALQGTLGVIAHELGHYFGLPDLYDVFAGTRPTIGFYALMATGNYNTVSRIPCHPMAWSKVFLGWETPVVITGDTEGFVLKAVELLGQGARIIKVPISSTEYFLIENRLRDENFNNRFDFNEVGGNNFFPDVMVDDYRMPDGRLAEFDWSIPNTNGMDSVMQASMDSTQTARIGSGVLIWHIDEEVIRAKLNRELTKNYVNTDPQHLGIDLEEADGVEHMIEQLPASIDPGFGSPFDAYGGAVEGVKTAALGNLNTAFGPYTSPSSLSYTGLPSNIRISGFRSVTVSPGEPVVDSLVAIDIHFNAVAGGEHIQHPLAGWPHILQAGTAGISPLVIDLVPGAPGAEVIQVTGDGRVYLATSTGEGRFVQAFGDSLSGSPAAGDITGDGLPELVAATSRGSLHAWHLDLEDGLSPAPGWPLHPGSSFTVGPVLADITGNGALDVIIGTAAGGGGSQLYAIDGRTGQFLPGFPVNIDNEVRAAAAVELDAARTVTAIYLGTCSGSLYGFSPGGSENFRLDLGSPVVCPPMVGRLGLPGTGGSDYKVCAFTSDGQVWVVGREGTVQPGWPVETGGKCLAGGAVGDVDGDGLNEIVVPVDHPDSLRAAQHRLHVFDFNGMAKPGFPVWINAPEVRSEPRYLGAPALADIDGDKAQEIFLCTGGRLCLVFSGNGNPRPLARFITGSNPLAAPVPADLDGNGSLDLLLADSEGYLYAYDTGHPGLDIQWAGLGAGPSRSGINLRLQSHPGNPASGEVLMENLCYVYPNPLRPADGGKVHIVYRLGREDVSRVTAKILTVSGEKVAGLEGLTVSAAGLSNEIIWDAGQVASGVYLVLITADSAGGGTVRVVRKVAVIK